MTMTRERIEDLKHKAAKTTAGFMLMVCPEELSEVLALAERALEPQPELHVSSECVECLQKSVEALEAKLEPQGQALPELPVPEMPHGSRDYFSASQMHQHADKVAGYYKNMTEQYDSVLRGLAFSLGAGGYNSEGLIDPKTADEKIRWGINDISRNASHLALPAGPVPAMTGDVTKCQRYYPDRYTGEMVPHPDGMYILLSDAQDCEFPSPAVAQPAEQSLRNFHDELGKMKWEGLDEGWNLAIAAVQKRLLQICDEEKAKQ